MDSENLLKENERLKELLKLSLGQNIESEKVGRVFHDFNNILSSFMGYSSLALERSRNTDDEKLVRYLENIEKAGIRARDLVRESLDTRFASRNANQVNVSEVLRDLYPAANLDSVDGVSVYVMKEQLIAIFELILQCYNEPPLSIAGQNVEHATCMACGEELRGQQVSLKVLTEASLDRTQGGLNLELAQALINSIGGHLCHSLTQDAQFVVYLRTVI